MLEQLKKIAHKLPLSRVIDTCGCGYYKIKKPFLWASLLVLGLLLILR